MPEVCATNPDPQIMAVISIRTSARRALVCMMALLLVSQLRCRKGCGLTTPASLGMLGADWGAAED
ncbi:hypothetical protein D3C76_1571530 [compost metagenome]